MSTQAPAPVDHNPFRRIVRDFREQAPLAFPPGERRMNMRRTHALAHDPLSVLLPAYERHGAVFTLRVLHSNEVFVLGPEANHHVLVSNASNFRWRDGGFGELIPLLGDGLLTIDGAHHKRARRIMLPAFHRERIAAASDVMVAEAAAALDRWQPGDVVDVYHWARELAMRIAMRALLGLDPDDGGTGVRAATEFERALSFYGTDFAVRILRGPGSPWWTMQRARRKLDEIVFTEIARRRAATAGRNGDGPGPGGEDILSMLLEATDEDGSRLGDDEVRDQAITLMFAGHDTTTSTISFLFHELARHPHELTALYAEQDEVLGGRAPAAPDLAAGLPRLDAVIDEVLRLYPPAWIGPRRAVDDCEIAGVRVPGGSSVNYSSWASHRIPEVFPEPEAFIPDRFTPERKAALPKGAYIPFGGGSRTCIGMRFGQMEIKAIATLALQRCRLELLPGRRMSVRQMPTLSPREPLLMRVRDRGVPVG